MSNTSKARKARKARKTAMSYGTESTERTRRMGPQGSETWSALLDAAERIMREKGYAAVTSRQLGAEAGLSPQIVYFYFQTMDELFETVFKRLAEGFRRAIDEARNAKEPLLAIWELSSDPTRGVIMSELLSLSNHRKQLQSVIGEFGAEFNRRQAEIIEAELLKRGVDLEEWPPSVLASILENTARGIAFGEGFSIASHTQARKFVTAFLRKLATKPRLRGADGASLLSKRGKPPRSDA